MKLLTKILILLVCMGMLCISVSAAGSAQSVQSTAQVYEDGGCDVSMRLQIYLEQAQKLSMPLPGNARDVRVNGKLKTPTAQGERLVVSLSELGAGVHTVEVSFHLDSAVTEKNGVLNLEVPLLTGFAFPVESFSFTVLMPGEVTATPDFSSDYYGQQIGLKMQVQVSGNAIMGSCTEKLNDRESLVMQYQADGDLFPGYSASDPLLGRWEALMAVLMVLALGYYLVALMPSFPKKVRSFGPPEGLAAGDIATCLTGCGMDLTMMVFSWAQMGYLTIRMDRRGRVQLQKRMEMGSERSEFENQAFQRLFSGRQTVDGMGLHYARLCRKLANKSPLLRQIYASRSGNPQIVRILAVAAGACSGVVLSGSVYTAGAKTVLLAMALAVLCGALSHWIQTGGRCIPLGNKLPLWLGAVCGGIWLLVGIWCGNVVLAAAMVVYETLTGLAAAVGGRRSETGRQYLAQIRGLRAHLTRGSIFDMQQCLEKNPDYFFDLMPYALALGVEKKFARRFGKVKLSECAYLEAPESRNLTPARWAVVLRQGADCLDRRQRRLQYEKMLEKMGKNDHKHTKKPTP